jgi:hypothetical protein
MHFTSSRLLTSGAAVLAAAALTLGGSLPASAAETDTTVGDPRPPMSPEAREAALVVADYISSHPRPTRPAAGGPEEVWNAWVAAEYDFLSGFPFQSGWRQHECTEKIPTMVRLTPAWDDIRASVAILAMPICPSPVPSIELVLTPRLAASDTSSTRD